MKKYTAGKTNFIITHQEKDLQKKYT